MAYEVTGSSTEYDGAIVRLRVDEVVQPDGSTAKREVVEHADSVGIVALDDEGRVLLIRQYRHPIGRYLWEVPAGLRDVEGEDPLEAARRELGEETGVRAERWSRLVDLQTSPGILTETCRVYLAQGLTSGDRVGAAEDEESDLEQRWVALGDALVEIEDGRISDSIAISGLYAAARVVEGRARPRPASVPG